MSNEADLLLEKLRHKASVKEANEYIFKLEKQRDELAVLAKKYAEHMFLYGDDPILSGKLHKQINKILEVGK